MRDITHAFKVLDSKYGDISLVFPRIKAELESLKDLPTSMMEESANIQEIINVTQALEKYGKKEAIDSVCIQRFRNKLQICTNSSFKAQAKTPSFNECCISGPDYLNCLESIHQMEIRSKDSPLRHQPVLS